MGSKKPAARGGSAQRRRPAKSAQNVQNTRTQRPQNRSAQERTARPQGAPPRSAARRPAPQPDRAQRRRTDRAINQATVHRSVKGRRRGSRGGNYIMYYILAAIIIIIVLAVLVEYGAVQLHLHRGRGKFSLHCGADNSSVGLETGRTCCTSTPATLRSVSQLPSLI